MVAISFDVVMAGIALAIAAIALLVAIVYLGLSLVEWVRIRREPIFPNFNGHTTDLRLLRDWRSWDKANPKWGEWID